MGFLSFYLFENESQIYKVDSSCSPLYFVDSLLLVGPRLRLYFCNDNNKRIETFPHDLHKKQFYDVKLTRFSIFFGYLSLLMLTRVRTGMWENGMGFRNEENEDQYMYSVFGANLRGKITLDVIVVQKTQVTKSMYEKKRWRWSLQRKIFVFIGDSVNFQNYVNFSRSKKLIVIN